MVATGQRDAFAKARLAGVALLILAATLAIAGSFMEWVTITPPPEVPADQAPRAEPFTGVEARDGWLIVAAAGLLVLFALGVVARARSGYGWMAFFTSIFIGSIAIADRRGLDELGSGIARRMDIVGHPEAALGLDLVAAAGIIGVIGSLVCIAGSPGAPRRGGLSDQEAG